MLTYGGHSSVTADGVTIVTPPSLDFGGVSVSTANAPASSVDVSLTNSIIRGPAYPLLANAAGTGEAKVNASYSDYDVNGDVTLGANATISEANVTNVGDAGFVAAGAGDYHLRPGSPLIDAGDPATAQGHDLDGNPLVTDGNRDGIARRDMGAFELQPPASAGGGQTGAGAVQQDGTPPSDTQSPLVNGFRAAPSVFAIAPAATPLAARLARGTRFRYTLSEDSRVTLTIQRALAGRRRGGQCVRPSLRLAHAKGCTRYRAVGTLSRIGKAGANSTRFSGRLGRRALRPGAYRAVIRATDNAGNRSAPRATRFRIATG